ncbi:hypothetical protein D9H04_07930 [Escherichia coli]|nr:hypothetical protein [Escherichia coli]EEW2469480.1 hypothetical protein [Escherichia coli]EGI4643103.1 hypothetical protein [Escherichia coli]MGR07706.1 hypothetical protein [Escherichia coli]MHT44889.1 hypothetical protein [Escherichia coli]
MLITFIKKVFGQDRGPTKASSILLDELLQEARTHQQDQERFLADLNAMTNQMAQVFQPDNLISAEWIDGQLYVKHRY